VDQRQLEWKAELAELLLHAAREFGESLEPERVYERFHELLADAVPHDGLIVSSYDERDDLIRAEYAWTDGAVLDTSKLPPIQLNREGGGMQSRVIVSGEPLLFNDVAERVTEPGGVYYNVDREGEVHKLPDTGPSGSSAAMMVPVKHEGRVVGVVQLMSDDGSYAENQLEIFEGLVAQMGGAVRNARLQQERRRLEAAEAAARAVAAERAQAARVVNAVGDGIFLLDEDGVVRLWNRAAELVTGLRRAVVHNQHLADVMPQWQELADRIPVSESGGMARWVTLPFRSDETDRWLSFTAVGIIDGVIYACRDVTAEHRLEEEKSDLIATISHELRTPMAAVYGAAKTLLRDDVDFSPERRQQLLEMIATQATRLSQITDEVLLTSRLDRDDLRVEAEPVDVADVVTETVEAFREQLDDSTSIEVEIPDDVGAVSGDRDRIQQVLVNLIDNAVKYGDSPVKVHAHDTDGVIRICVADNGQGIALAEQPRIFEKFYRADPDLARSPGGTGLGLYISRELTRRMGGTLDLTSEPGAGATFVVELPQA
jgi:two-component system, OmpR family, phosphate regulon sensor histidine kinase PhoR